ncbi:D-alanyl-D-alanine carboxypeptidase [Microbacterium capsulatum]|uniref:D-alanyl-D-alanine carboxypeptidase n=1 Tax=Microbacterium capsulatum TaxID=3041921 RepID=A0ABU0XKU6_9MICO|nr:D-alanyl-D-alanine carboxypeptidase [Microbacterium sp. ASV81]MDQ4215772.1 D-alanyl-D-alanine carboxypeptidase [Microbacterium sp. ASV81]
MNTDDRSGAEAGDADNVDPHAPESADGVASATAVLEDPAPEHPVELPELTEMLFPTSTPAEAGPVLAAPVEDDALGALTAVEAEGLPSALAVVDPSPVPVGIAREALAVDSGSAALAPAAETSAPASAGDVPAVAAPDAPARRGRSRRRTDPTPTDALSWLDIAAFGSAVEEPAPQPAPAPRALLADAPHRSLLRPGVLVPTTALLLVAVAYGATAASWPLSSVPPAASAVTFQPAAAPSAAVTWPTTGSAAVAIDGIGTIASNEQKVPMASITKLVTVLASFDKLPLKVGEQGKSFDFTRADHSTYQRYLRNDESALDVPVGGSLTQYQLLEGILLGSANNYADRLSHDVWGSDDDYAAAANRWLQQHDLGGITVVNPSGFEFGNVASPRALIQLGQLAEQNPVIAEIVRKKSVDLPGAGVVENTNGLIDDTGIVGIKTGTIGDGAGTEYNLLTAKDVSDGSTTVRIYVTALGQPSSQSRVDVSRKLYADVEAALKDQPPTVIKGETLGRVDTAWGETTEVVAAADARVVLWNGAAAGATTQFALGKTWRAGDKAGTLALKGPLDSATVPLALRTTLNGPDFWWRITHPLQLLGLTR